MRSCSDRLSRLCRWAGVLLSACAAFAVARAAPVDDAVAAMRQAGADIDKQAGAVRSLTAIGAPAVAPLIQDLTATDRQVRLNAALALGRLQAVRAVEALLVRCREDTDPEVRGAAAEALGRIGDMRAVGPLVGMLTRADANELDRRGAAVALGYLRAPRAVEPLLRLLDSPNWEERWRAAVALGQIGEPRTRRALGRLTLDANLVVAGCAAWADSRLRRTPDVGVLERNLSSKDDGVVWGSAWALGVIGTTEAAEALQTRLKDGSATAQSACRMVLTWLGVPAAATPAATAAAADGSEELMALADRWSDNYGKLDIRITRPRILSSRVAHPELGAHARPCLYRLPDGDLLLAVDPDPDATAAPRAVLRSRDQGKTWKPEPDLVPRIAAVATLRSRSVLVYDEYLFQKEGQQYASDLCVSRDGGRAFGPLQFAEFALNPDQASRSQPQEVVDAYKASSAQWSDRACPGLSARVVEADDGSLVACGLTRRDDAASAGGVCYRSTDKGMNWTAGAALARDGVSALALTRGAENRLVTLLTIGTEPTLYTSVSGDSGATWTQPRNLGVRGATVDLCRLPSGVLACGYGGPGVGLMFNVDGAGKSWTDKIRLAESGEGVSGGLSLCEAGPDRLLLVYDRQGVFPEVDAAPTTALFGVYITAVRPADAP